MSEKKTPTLPMPAPRVFRRGLDAEDDTYALGKPEPLEPPPGDEDDDEDGEPEAAT